MTDTTQPAAPHTVEQVKIAVVAVASLATIIAGILAEGKVGVWQVLTNSGAIISALSALAHLSATEIVTEIKGLNETDKAAVAELFKEHFHLASATIEGYIDMGVAYLLDAVDGVTALLSLKKQA